MLKEWDYAQQLQSLPSPILVMIGDDDYISLDQHRNWAANSNNVQLKIVPNGGHNLWIDEPKVFRETVQSYLALVSKTQ